MKSTILLTSILFSIFFNLKKNPSDFDNNLSEIVTVFKSNIIDKNECEDQKNAAADLADEIKKAINNEDDYDSDELIKLKKLEKEAIAVEEFIASVGNCGNYIPSIKNFNLANSRVGANVNNVIIDEYCVDIISVSIGNYVAYLGENNSVKDYTVTYKWKAPNGNTTGSGKMGLTKFCVRHIYDNREKPKQKYISILGITCTEF